MVPAKLTPTVEDYLRTIYVLEEEIQPVIAARVAEEMGVSASTMVSTLRRLQREGYVKVERRKEINLTLEGRKIAEGILRRHYLIERLMTDLLGLDWVKAHQEAHRLEHAVSQEVEDSLFKLNNPITCPHGNFIPGRSHVTHEKAIPLHQVPAGREVELEYITEGAERDARLLGLLQQNSLIPGTKIRVVDVAPSLGMISLKVGRNSRSVLKRQKRSAFTE